MNESRQVRRARERKEKKGERIPVTHQVYWIPLKRKSRAGVEYTYYKKITDKVGLDKNVARIKDTVNKRKSSN